ncbi:MAG: hypothetical protein ACRDPT_03845 [Streptomycetales bacterium]
MQSNRNDGSGDQTGTVDPADVPQVLRRIAGLLESVAGVPAGSVSVSTGCYSQMIQVCEPVDDDMARIGVVNRILAALGARGSSHRLRDGSWHYAGDTRLDGLRVAVFTALTFDGRANPKTGTTPRVCSSGSARRGG